MDQKTAQFFRSACGKAIAYVENDMPLGSFHDFLMELKGNMVDRMVSVHKQEQEITDAKKQEENLECESKCITKED